MALILGNGTEDAEFGGQILADVHDGCNIAAAVAVVGSGPDGDNGLVLEVVLEENQYMATSQGRLRNIPCNPR